jgi:hypothetical protein
MDQEPDLEFDMRLCRELGWRSVERMRRRMSAAEWVAWATFYGRAAQREELQRLRRGW